MSNIEFENKNAKFRQGKHRAYHISCKTGHRTCAIEVDYMNEPAFVNVFIFMIQILRPVGGRLLFCHTITNSMVCSRRESFQCVPFLRIEILFNSPRHVVRE